MNRKRKETVPSGALKLVEDTSPISFLFSDPGDDGSPSTLKGFNMVGYSGKVIFNHWYWGNLVISLSGMSFPKKVYPILRDHDTDKEIGFSKKPSVTDKGLLFSQEEVTFLDNEESQKFIQNSKAGFPYQASIRAVPTRIVRLAEGEEREVNGFTFKGPGTVWTECTFEECSVCVFGYDRNTSSEAFSDEKSEISLSFVQEVADKEHQPMEGGTSMSLKKFKEEHPDAFADLMKEAKAEAATEFSAQAKTAEEENEKLKKENKDLTIKLSQKDGEVNEFSKRLTILEENSKKTAALSNETQAKTIFAALLSASGIPANLHSKVENMVSFSKFVKDDKLDVDAFKAAATAEVQDWEKQLGASGPSVQGFSATATDVTGDMALQGEDAATLEFMASHLNLGKTKQ